MEVSSPCGDVIFTQEIGPFSSDVTVPNIIYLESNGLGFITGMLSDCGGDPGEGYITMTTDGGFPESVEVASDGSFTIAMACAPQEVTMTGYAADYLSNSGDVIVNTIRHCSIVVIVKLRMYFHYMLLYSISYQKASLFDKLFFVFAFIDPFGQCFLLI